MIAALKNRLKKLAGDSGCPGCADWDDPIEPVEVVLPTRADYVEWLADNPQGPAEVCPICRQTRVLPAGHLESKP